MGNKNHKHKKRECPCCCNCIREEPKKYTLLSYNPEEPKCKIGVLGDSKTGKTCFCNRLAYNITIMIRTDNVRVWRVKKILRVIRICCCTCISC